MANKIKKIVFTKTIDGTTYELIDRRLADLLEGDNSVQAQIQNATTTLETDVDQKINAVNHRVDIISSSLEYTDYDDED